MLPKVCNTLSRSMRLELMGLCEWKWGKGTCWISHGWRLSKVNLPLSKLKHHAVPGTEPKPHHAKVVLKPLSSMWPSEALIYEPKKAMKNKHPPISHSCFL